MKFHVKEYSVIPPPYGGVSVYLDRLIKRMNSDGFLVGGYYTNDNTCEEYHHSPLFDLYDWNSHMSKKTKLVYHIKRLIKAIRDYEIIHLHGQELLALYAICHLILRTKFVITVHNAMLGEFYHRQSYINKLAFKYFAKSNIPWIAVSEQSKEELLKLPIDFRNPIDVIPAYIPDQSPLIGLPTSIENYIKSHERNMVFYGRSFMQHNGHDVYGFKTAISAYSKIKESSNGMIGLVLCLSDVTDKKGIEELKDYAIKLGVYELIYWQLGGISTMRCLWSRCDVYIRPTYTDGDSVSIRDAMAEGMHVVASDVCTRPSGVEIYKYGDESDFINKIFLCLAKQRNCNSEIDIYYTRMKDIYSKLLYK